MSRKSRSRRAEPQATSTAAKVPPSAGPSGRRHVVVASVVVLVAIVAVIVLVILQSSDPGKRPGLESRHSPTAGEETAKVHVVEFLDPACETCATFYPLIKQLMAENPKRIRVSIRHVPFHKGSDTVVAMLEASRKQDKYWPTLETLLATQELWTIDHVAHPDLARKALAGVGLDWERLAADMKSPEVGERMTLDRAEAAQLKVTKTPEYFVNGRQMATFGRQQLRRLVLEEIARAY
jgi:protein-disulfide isomerase